MTTKLSTIGKWIGAAIAAVVITGTSFLGFHAFNARAHANSELQSGAQSPQSDSIEQSGPNQEPLLNPQNQHRLRLRSPLPQRAYKREAKSAHRRQHYGLWNCGNTRSTQVTQKNSTKSVKMATSASVFPTR